MIQGVFFFPELKPATGIVVKSQLKQFNVLKRHLLQKIMYSENFKTLILAFNILVPFFIFYVYFHVFIHNYTETKLYQQMGQWEGWTHRSGERHAARPQGASNPEEAGWRTCIKSCLPMPPCHSKCTVTIWQAVSSIVMDMTQQLIELALKNGPYYKCNLLQSSQTHLSPPFHTQHFEHYRRVCFIDPEMRWLIVLDFYDNKYFQTPEPLMRCFCSPPKPPQSLHCRRGSWSVKYFLHAAKSLLFCYLLPDFGKLSWFCLI